MNGPEYEAPPSGISAFRWIIPGRIFEEHPEHSWILSTGVTTVGTEGEAYLFCYPCRSKTLVNMVGFHPDARDQENTRMYLVLRFLRVYLPVIFRMVDIDAETTVDHLLEVYNNYHPKFKDLLALATDVKDWQLRQLPSLPTWRRGRVIIMGDAAHAMFPSTSRFSSPFTQRI
jgi:salicylate hydroxylase